MNLRPWLFVVAFLAAGCSHVDTGQVDYRVADAPERTLECHSSPTEPCPPRRPAPLTRRYDTAQSAFRIPVPEDRQLYSIHLDQVSIGRQLLEGVIFGREFGRSGQFVILANVFEFDAAAGEAEVGRFLESYQYSGENGTSTELKVVHFAPDVRRNQTLNLSSLPLTGRQAYNGRTIGIQIVIMEVDASGPMSSLLVQLAQLGVENVPVPGTGRDVLRDLGQSLLNGRSDDTIFDYRFALLPPNNDRNSILPAFGPGRYVLRRSENRRTPMNWSNLELDHNTGRLFRRIADNQYEEFRDDMYLVITVAEWAHGTSPEVIAQDSWSSARPLIAAAANPDSGPLAALEANVSRLVGSARSDGWRARLLGNWATATSALDTYTKLLAELDPAQFPRCTLHPETVRNERRAIAKRNAQDAVRRFVVVYQEALARTPMPTTENPSPTSEFAEIDRDAVVSAVARPFMPWASAEDEARFSEAATFETTFIKSGSTRNLIDDAISAAEANPEAPVSCDDVTGRGLGFYTSAAEG